MATKKKHCFVCGRTENEVSLLLSGNEGFICDDCIMSAYKLLVDAGYQVPSGITPSSSSHQHRATDFKSIPKPQEIKAFLDRYIIGQDDAKRYLSVAVYNH